MKNEGLTPMWEPVSDRPTVWMLLLSSKVLQVQGHGSLLRRLALLSKEGQGD